MSAAEVTPEADARWSLQTARIEQLEAERKYIALEKALKQASRDMQSAVGRRLAAEKKLRDLGVAVPSRTCHT